MFYTNDPIADFNRHDLAQQKQLSRLPQCCECDEPIQSEFCYEINGELLCEDCLKTYHRKAIEDYVE